MFVGRDVELGFLGRLKPKEYCVLTVFGRRRTGKTTLLKQAFPDCFYVFVPKGRTTQFILDLAAESYDVPRFTRFGDLLDYASDKGLVVVVDEVQNFLVNDAGVFGEMQDVVDRRKMAGKKLRLVLSGSSYSMLNKLFSGNAPLYGRRTNTLEVRELPFSHARALASGLCGVKSIEGQVEAWAAFGGVPYYYEVLAGAEGSSVRGRLAGLFNPITGTLKDEAKLLVSSEFGDEYRTYSTIISGVAGGKTRPNELASLFGNSQGNLNKYLHVLVSDYRFVVPERPVFGSAREVRYRVNDNFLSFWHSFVERNLLNIEGGNFGAFVSYVEKNFDAFVGLKFEDLALQLARDGKIPFPFKPTAVGRQWGRVPARKGETYEIDLLAADVERRQVAFGECKWSHGVDGEKVERELAEKALHVPLPEGEWKKRFIVFAKSFAKKPRDAIAVDLAAIEKTTG